jgi:predicted phage terminase large subunit-like protein
VFRRKLDFPNLKRAVKDQKSLHSPAVILIEDKASGTALIQELRADGLSMVEAAPSIDGDKVMRLRAQTAKIEGGFVLLPKEASWLNSYVLELLSFPNSRHDDQVDSTVFALAWLGLSQSSYGWTKEGLDALGRVQGFSVYDQVMRRLGQLP